MNTNDKDLQKDDTEVVEKFNIEIEKLLSEEDDDDNLDLSAQDYKQRRQSENISNQNQFSDNSLTKPTTSQCSFSKAPMPLISQKQMSSNSENNIVSTACNL